MNRLSLFSPSKLNLFFRVIKRRSDGYHEIASIFQAISLGDVLEVEMSESDLITCTDSQIPCDRSNLVYKALHLFRAKTGLTQKVHFHLKKRVPIQAGLGGGSGNAATALWALNMLFQTKVNPQELCLWSAEIGSDVPFFFSLGTAYCTGRGEILRELSPLRETSLWLAKPNLGLSTPLVYNHCDPASLSSIDPLSVVRAFLEEKPSYFNDLELSAFKLMPELERLKEQLLALGFHTAVMTGSGTAFFCLGEVVEPNLDGITFFKVNFLRREEGSWYQFSDSDKLRTS